VEPPEEDASQSRAIQVWIVAPETITVVTDRWHTKSVKKLRKINNISETTQKF